MTHDPNPDRIDGIPPVYEPEKIMVASLSSIRGLLVQSVVGQTGEDQKIYYFINDHLGTPQKLLDENADVVWSANYKPFGEANVNVEAFANQFRLPGQYFDSETGLHYNLNRYYDSKTGSYNYDYDDLYRLADVDNPDSDDEAFTYDGVGNRLTAEGATGDWSYNTNNELTGYNDVSYVYDANGNTTNKTSGTSVTRYIYNAEDRLSEVRDGSDNLIASYYYDPFGRRLWKEVSGVRTYFFYADEGLIGEYDSTGNEIKSYGYKPGSTWTTDPLFMKEGSSYYFYHTDHLGTPQKMTAVNGAVVWSAKYSSFGEATVDAVSTITNNLRFPGQYFDAESGLHYNYHRYYDPKTGRYLRTDPIGLAGMEPNIYGYVLNDPVNLLDPLGLFTESYYNLNKVSNYDRDYGGSGSWAQPKKGGFHDFNERLTLGQQMAFMKIGGGIAAIYLGVQGAKPKMIGIGITAIASGFADAIIEALGGDATKVPLPPEIVYRIVKGIGKSVQITNENNCDSLTDG